MINIKLSYSQSTTLTTTIDSTPFYSSTEGFVDKPEDLFIEKMGALTFSSRRINESPFRAEFSKNIKVVTIRLPPPHTIYLFSKLLISSTFYSSHLFVRKLLRRLIYNMILLFLFFI